jgi:hypothetical protein
MPGKIYPWMRIAATCPGRADFLRRRWEIICGLLREMRVATAMENGKTLRQAWAGRATWADVV